MTIRAHRRRLVCGIVALLIGASAAHAHEIGTTRVSLLLAESDRYEIEVVTDAATLLGKLEGVSGANGATPPGTPGKPGRPGKDEADDQTLLRRLAQLEPVFRQRVTVAVDGVPVRPDIAWTVSGADPMRTSPLAIIKLSGGTPAGAKHLTWTYAWTFTPYAFVARRAPSVNATTEWLEGGETATPVPITGPPPPPASRLQIIGRYVALGYTHILPKGLDHVLFVLGIFLLSRRARPILLQVSAFTIAHSITLALGMYGFVRLPATVVEPAISLSIAYVALENMFTSDLQPWRYGLVFAFGLLHGLGFAGALSEVGLPRAEFLTALVGFNAGVELGQLTVVAAAFLLVGHWFGRRTWYRQRIVLPASCGIAVAGVYWTIQRLGFFA
jgi:hypothetical protein